MSLSQIRRYVNSRTGHLAATYLAIIMAMTIIFSFVIFTIAARQFDRPLEGRGSGRIMMGAPDDIRILLDQRAAEARAELILSLLLLNLGVLGFGIWFSTYLAARTMEPIERAMREQAQFVTDASHELRTPLTALTSLNEVALRRKAKISDVDARDLAAKNVAEANKLYALTTSLLGLVHADQHIERARPVELQRAVSDALEHVVQLAQQKSINIEDAVPNIRVLTRADKLTQVIKILLENAVKYSKAQGTVRLFAETQGALVTLSVADSGMGIAPQDMPRIFDRFYRADQSRGKSKNEGFGIGLAIAKAISDQCSMNIRVESTFGKGATFSIDLPLVDDRT